MAAAIAVGGTVGVAATGCTKSQFKTIRFDPPEPAPAVSLPRADGSTFNLRDQRGSVVLIFFGYTHCPDVCPTTLADWKKIKRGLGADAKRVKFVFVSVDPNRDTPAVAQHYVDGFDSSFIGLSGDSAQVTNAETAFHVTSSIDGPPTANGYTVTHAAQVFIIDRKSRVRLLYPFGFPIESVVSDVQKLVHNA